MCMVSVFCRTHVRKARSFSGMKTVASTFVRRMAETPGGGFHPGALAKSFPGALDARVRLWQSRWVIARCEKVMDYPGQSPHSAFT